MGSFAGLGGGQLHIDSSGRVVIGGSYVCLYLDVREGSEETSCVSISSGKRGDAGLVVSSPSFCLLRECFDVSPGFQETKSTIPWPSELCWSAK